MQSHAGFCLLLHTHKLSTDSRHVRARPHHRHSQDDTGARGHPGGAHSPAGSAQHTAAGIRPASMTLWNKLLCETRLPSTPTPLHPAQQVSGSPCWSDCSKPSRKVRGPDLSSAGRTQRNTGLTVHRIAGSERTAHDPRSL